MKRTLALAALLVCLSPLAGCRPRDASEVKGSAFTSTHEINNQNRRQEPATTSPLPDPKGFVNDFAGVLDADAKESLESKLREFKERDDVEMAVAVVETTGDQPIFDYSLAVARGWGIGRSPAGDGALLFIAIKDRKWQIQISRSLEKVLSDDEIKQIGSLMSAPFKEARYGEGVTKCVDAFISALENKRRLPRESR
ncbi:MAG TPA: TPM domain-containing protein [Pyrinomonadaceae bacterium]|jgi:uncharacterized protein|nr:TPM domain-containing protein [Pyrinomonadaceae bacterium]